MGILKTDDRRIENASRRLFQEVEKNLAFKQLYHLMKDHPEVRRQVRKSIILPKPQKNFDNTDLNINRCEDSSCIGKGVLDLLLRRPKFFTFKEACAILEHCDVTKGREVFEDVTRKYSIVIIGLKCAEDDFDLAVYLFLVNIFEVQPNTILLWLKIFDEEYKKDAIGVLFDSVTVRENIVEKLDILEGSGIVISLESEMSWIVDEFEKK